MVTIGGRSKVDEDVLAAYHYDVPKGFIVTNARTNYDLLPWCTVGIELNNTFNVQYEVMACYRMPRRSYAVNLSLRE